MAPFKWKATLLETQKFVLLLTRTWALVKAVLLFMVRMNLVHLFVAIILLEIQFELISFLSYSWILMLTEISWL